MLDYWRSGCLMPQLIHNIDDEPLDCPVPLCSPPLPHALTQPLIPIDITPFLIQA